MRAWAERSPEVAALLNPAFCGVVMYAAVDGFAASDNGGGMPFELAFLILPLVLHKPSRDLFPQSVRTPFHSWWSENPSLQIGLAERVRAASELTREALMYLMSAGAVRAVGGMIATGSAKPKLSRARSVEGGD